MRNKSESSKLGDQEDLKRLTAELEVVPFDQNTKLQSSTCPSGGPNLLVMVTEGPLLIKVPLFH